ncbi:MAG: heavy-metal-associated domain-containing protein [Candidatus Aenigmarchaeota archaeon]|nr:heavy-metal-associated domain-containing protein [Candidatus Aenigmarchaeota archaeon]
MKQTLTIKGMHCTSCEGLMKDILADYGITQVSADYKKGLVTFSANGPVPLEKITAEIKAAGYTVAGVA